MNRSDVVLAALATDSGKDLTPTQVQKFLFLLDKHVSDPLGGPHWNFVPYDYGPFDAEVYLELESLSRNGLVSIVPFWGTRRFSALFEGLKLGCATLDSLPASVKNYIERVGCWVRSLTFQQLVSAICRDFPDMCLSSLNKEM